MKTKDIYRLKMASSFEIKASEVAVNDSRKFKGSRRIYDFKKKIIMPSLVASTVQKKHQFNFKQIIKNILP